MTGGIEAGSDPDGVDGRLFQCPGQVTGVLWRRPSGCLRQAMSLRSLRNPGPGDLTALGEVPEKFVLPPVGGEAIWSLAWGAMMATFACASAGISTRIMKKTKVLILCTGNSCRSHMAEGILRHAAGDLFEVFSAGSKPAGYVHPTAIEVLAETGIDISGHESKHLDQFLDAGIGVVITVCDNANDACPIFPGRVRRHHWGFEDPPKAARPGELEIDAFRRIRDEIRAVFEAYADGFRDALDAPAT